MENRINDLCEALNQFLLGILPMAGAIQDDLQELMSSGTSTFSVADCRRMLKILADVKEMDIQLGIKLHEIRYLISLMMPSETEIKEPKPKPTAEDAIKALKGLSQEEIYKLLGELKKE